MDKVKLKKMLKKHKKREIVEEEIIKPKAFCPAPTKGPECPKLAEKPINKKIKIKKKK
jgi:hypothetical protein